MVMHRRDRDLPEIRFADRPTLTSLLSGDDRLKPLTLWDLSRAITAVVCYDNLFHFEPVGHRLLSVRTKQPNLGYSP